MQPKNDPDIIKVIFLLIPAQLKSVYYYSKLS